MGARETVRFRRSIPVYDEVLIETWSHSMPLYSRISWTAMPNRAPPRQISHQEGRPETAANDLQASSIESRNSESAEMKILSKGPIDIVSPHSMYMPRCR